MNTTRPDQPEAIDDTMLRQMMRDDRGSLLDQYGYCFITFVLIAVNVIVFIVELVRSGTGTSVSTQTLFDMGAMWAPAIQSPADSWRFVTPMFLHVDVMHLLFNMAALYSVGVMLEQLLGKANYLLLYFVAGITGNAVSYIADLALGTNVVSAGASTSIFGLFMATAMLGLLSKYDREVLLQYSKGMLAVIGVNIVYTLAMPSVSVSGHLGGALGGVLGMLMIPASNLRVPVAVRVLMWLAWLAAMGYVVFAL